MPENATGKLSAGDFQSAPFAGGAVLPSTSSSVKRLVSQRAHRKAFRHQKPTILGLLESSFGDERPASTTFAPAATFQTPRGACGRNLRLPDCAQLLHRRLAEVGGDEIHPESSI